MSRWIGLSVVILLTVAANVLLKLAAQRLSTMTATTKLESLIALATEWRLITAVSCYGLAFLVYGYELRRIDLSVAYPILASVTLMLVAVVSIVVLGEPFGTAKAIGTALVIGGVILLSLGQGGAAERKAATPAVDAPAGPAASSAEESTP